MKEAALGEGLQRRLVKGAATFILIKCLKPKRPGKKKAAIRANSFFWGPSGYAKGMVIGPRK